MCEACKQYEKQSELLDKGIANAYKKMPLDDSMDGLKKKIIKKSDALNSILKKVI